LATSADISHGVVDESVAIVVAAVAQLWLGEYLACALAPLALSANLLPLLAGTVFFGAGGAVIARSLASVLALVRSAGEKKEAERESYRTDPVSHGEPAAWSTRQ
jgi:hypothetical protein